MADKVNFNFYIEGEMAEAFVQEWRKQLPVSKSKIARAALVEYLNKRGFNVKDTVQDWGGGRTEQDEDSPELAEVGTA